MRLKRPLSILTALCILLVSVIIPGTGILSSAEGGGDFTAQHMDIDFSKYNENANDTGTSGSTNIGKYHMYSTGTAGASATTPYTDINWSFPEESGNKFLRYTANTKTATFPTKNAYAYNMFIMNATGNLPSGGEGSFQLESGATYRISFKYRLMTSGSPKTVALRFARRADYRGSGNAAPSTGTQYSGSGICNLEKTTEWKTVTTTIDAGDFSDTKSTLIFYVRIGSGIAPNNASVADYQVDIDDFQVDKIATANVELVMNNIKQEGKTQQVSLAPTCAYSKHFFSAESGDYAGGVVNKDTGKLEDIEAAFAAGSFAPNVIPEDATFHGLYDTIEATTPLTAIPQKTGATLYAKYTGEVLDSNELFINGTFTKGDLRGYKCYDGTNTYNWSKIEVVDAPKSTDTGVTLADGKMAYIPGRTSAGTGDATGKAMAGESNLNQELSLKRGKYQLTFDADFTPGVDDTSWDIGVHTSYNNTYKRCSGTKAVTGLKVSAVERGTTNPITLSIDSTNKYSKLVASKTDTIHATITMEFFIVGDDPDPVYFGIGHNVKKANPGSAYVDNISLIALEGETSKITFEDLNDEEPNKVLEEYEGATISLTSPTKREGYLFKGWFKDNETFKEAATDIVPVDDVTYYAKWVPFKVGNWEGDTAKPAKGDGKEASPFEITNAKELAWAVQQYGTKSAGKYFKLMNDITINDYTAPDWYNFTNDWHVSAWTGSGDKDFQGTFDGDGHVIRGLCVNTSAETDEIGGLFLTLGPNAVIKNVGIENSYVKAYKFAGAFAAATKNSSTYMTTEAAPQFIACYVGDDVYVETVKSGSWDNGFAGGFVGWVAFPMNFRYCYSKAEVKTATVGEKIGYGGAFIGGSNQSGDIVKYRSCYSYPADPAYNMQGYSKSGGAKGTNTYATANKNGTTEIVKGVTLVSDLSMIGEEAKLNMPNLDYEKIWITRTGDTPQLRIFTDEENPQDPATHTDPFEMPIVKVEDLPAPGTVWSGAIAEGFKSEKDGLSDGTVDKPHLIATAEELAYFHSLLTDSYYNNWKTTGKYYKITHDIYLNDTSAKNWYESEDARQWLTGTAQNQGINGHLDGDGHIVYGLFFDADNEEFVGLFPSIVMDGTVTRLGIASSYIFNTKGAAAMFSYAYSGSNYVTLPTISECFIAEDVTISSAEGSAAGFVASLPGGVKIENSVFLGVLEGARDNTGGLIGYSWLGDPKYPKYYKDTETHITQELVNCLVADDGRSQAVAEKGYDDFEKGTNVYTRGNNRAGISTQVPMSKMTGENARTYLKGFDFENVWQIVDKGTPVLKCFADKGVSIDLLSKPLVPTVITFETYGGSEIEPITAYAGSALTLPTPTRNADIFDGWYVYPHKTWDVKFTYDFVPDDNITLYAKWISKSIEEDFEEYPFITADEYGLEGDFEVHRLGSIDYNPDYIHGGARALRRLGFVEGYKNASLNNGENKLVKGAEYTATLWLYLKEAPAAETELKLAYLQHADWAYDELATETIYDLKNLKVGEWTQIKFDFVAYSEYLGLSVPQCDLFIDDFEAIYTAKTGLKSNAVVSKPETITTIIPAEIENTGISENDKDDDDETTTSYKVVRRKKKKADTNNAWVIYAVIIASAVVIAAAGAVGFIIVRKKRRTKI